MKSSRYHCIWKYRYVASVAVTLTCSVLAASYRAKGSTFFNLLNPTYYACLLNWLPVVCRWLQKFNKIRRSASFPSCEASLISLSGCECMHILSNCWCWEAWNQEATFHLSVTHQKLCSHFCCFLTASVYRRWLLLMSFWLYYSVVSKVMQWLSVSFLIVSFYNDTTDHCICFTKGEQCDTIIHKTQWNTVA